MGRLRCGGWACVCALFLASTAFALEVPLTYQRYPDEQNDFRPYGSAHPKLATTPPEGNWKLPSFNSAKPLYGVFELGGTKRLCVLDCQTKGTELYDRLYLDDDGDQDLTSEKPIDGHLGYQNGDNWSIEFPTQGTAVALGEGKVTPYSYRPQLWGFRPKDAGQVKLEDGIQFGLRLNCAYSGQFSLDGKTYDVQFGDSDVNGRFDDAAAVPEGQGNNKGRAFFKGDQVYISADGKASYYDCQLMAKTWLLGSKLFEVAFDPAKLKLTLTPSTQKTSTLKIPADVTRVSLCGKAAGAGLLAYGMGDSLAIPEGEYQLISYQMLRTEKCGDKWRLGGTSQWETPPIVVAASGESKATFGEPFVPVVAMNGRGPENSVRLEFSIQGNAQELVTDLARVSGDKGNIAMASRNGSLPKEPTYRIAKPDGEVAASGSFEYG